MARTSQIRARRAAQSEQKPTSLDEYSDASSTYWPEGWSFARYRVSEQADLFALPEGELEKLRVGFRTALGEDGVDHMGELLFAEFKARQEKAEPSPEETPVLRPGWLTVYERQSAGREWGYVGFRTCLYDDEERWKAYKTKVEEIARLPFQIDEGVPGVQEAATHFSIQWEEDEVELKDASMETLQSKFAGLSTSLPADTPSALFLLATPSTVDALLAADAPNTSSTYWRRDAPYILAAAACLGGRDGLEEETDDWENYKEIFCVAVEVLVAELWVPLVQFGSSPWKLARSLEGWRWRNGEVLKEVGKESTGDDEDKAGDVWWSSFPNPHRGVKRRRCE